MFYILFIFWKIGKEKLLCFHFFKFLFFIIVHVCMVYVECIYATALC